jgi:hypothetical protein
MASTLHARFQSSGYLPVGTLKNPCVDNEGALHHRTVGTFETIRNYPGVFERMRRSLMRRVEA